MLSPEVIGGLGTLAGALGIGSAIHQMVKNRGKDQDRKAALEMAAATWAAEERKLLVSELHSLLATERQELQESRDAHSECLTLVHKVQADLDALRKEHAGCPGQLAELRARLEAQDQRIFQLSRSMTPGPMPAVKG